MMNDIMNENLPHEALLKKVEVSQLQSVEKRGEEKREKYRGEIRETLTEWKPLANGSFLFFAVLYHSSCLLIMITVLTSSFISHSLPL
jgi:hypothetical protein